MLVHPQVIFLGHLNWLALVVFCLGIVCMHCLPTEPPIIFSYDNSTPFPNALKCYTCEDKQDNSECNRRAYDAFCPEGTKYCYTSHHLYHESGESINVNKLCATSGECRLDSVGCVDMHEPGVKRCVSCCEGSRCNEGVPTNSSTAIFTTITPYSGGTISQSSRKFTALCFVLSTVLVRRWLW